jgi:hypothetical protein
MNLWAFQGPKKWVFGKKQTSQNLRETLTLVKVIITKFIW